MKQTKNTLTNWFAVDMIDELITIIASTFERPNGVFTEMSTNSVFAFIMIYVRKFCLLYTISRVKICVEQEERGGGYFTIWGKETVGGNFQSYISFWLEIPF